MILFSNAKINVGLNVGTKRTDGFHDIQSVFYPIPFKDIIEITPHHELIFENSGIQINKEHNLILDAYNLLQKNFNVGQVKIHLHKQIPLGSGLGGGSSNAVSTLIGLNHIFNLELSRDTLLDLALQLGSDCPFFVYNEPKLISGRGELIQETSISLSGMHIKLVNLGIHVSTQEAFFGLVPKEEPFVQNLANLKNDFEPNLFRSYPELQEVKDALLGEGAIYASLSGTGSTVYGVFENQPKLSGTYKLERIFKLG